MMRKSYNASEMNMSARLAVALSEMLEGWIDDLSPAWRDVFVGTELGLDDIDPDLELCAHEPIYPTRKTYSHPESPEGAHIFRAFDDIEPNDVRCVLLGQDPYPSIEFSTGRAFEVGSYRSWRNLEEMFTHSLRCFTQCVCAARSERPALARNTSGWKDTIDLIESGEIDLESPPDLVQRWVDQGVLLVNSSLTISRFEVAGHPHQLRGHIPLWRPFIVRLLRYLIEDRPVPVVVVLFGDVAKSAHQATITELADASIVEESTVATEHPAAGDDFLKNGNPLTQCNSILVSRGERPIDW